MTDEQMNPGAVIARWWHENIGARDEARSGRVKALAARLRRAEKVEALVEPEVFKLSKALNTQDVERLYRIAKVLAHVKGEHRDPLARRLGGDPPVLSSLRFQRLMRAEGDELTTGLVRALTMADGACHVGRLAGDLFFWNDRTRTRWIFDYHGAAVPETLEEVSQ